MFSRFPYFFAEPILSVEPFLAILAISNSEGNNEFNIKLLLTFAFFFFFLVDFHIQENIGNKFLTEIPKIIHKISLYILLFQHSKHFFFILRRKNYSGRGGGSNHPPPLRGGVSKECKFIFYVLSNLNHVREM